MTQCINHQIITLKDLQPKSPMLPKVGLLNFYEDKYGRTFQLFNQVQLTHSKVRFDFKVEIVSIASNELDCTCMLHGKRT